MILSISDSDPRVPAELGQENQASSWVEEWNSACLLSCSGMTGHLSSCMWNLQVFPDDVRGCQCPFMMCLRAQGCLQRGVRASGSSQERTAKSRSFGMWHHPRGYVSNFLVRPASSGGALGRLGNPFRPRRGIDSPVAIRRGEGAQMKWCRDPRCSPRGNPACRGTFGGHMKGVRYHFTLQDGTWDFP